MNKRLYLVGGAMGVGKTTACQCLKAKTKNTVYLDGDWCWDMHPFTVNDETKAMVQDNILHLLNNFLRCSAFDTVIFSWVMHRQEIIDGLLSGLATGEGDAVFTVSLVCGEEELRRRLMADVRDGKRTEDVIARSVSYLPLYDSLSTIKLDVTSLTPEETADRLARLPNP